MWKRIKDSFTQLDDMMFGSAEEKRARLQLCLNQDTLGMRRRLEEAQFNNDITRTASLPRYSVQSVGSSLGDDATLMRAVSPYVKSKRRRNSTALPEDARIEEERAKARSVPSESQSFSEEDIVFLVPIWAGRPRLRG